MKSTARDLDLSFQFLISRCCIFRILTASSLTCSPLIAMLSAWKVRHRLVGAVRVQDAAGDDGRDLYRSIREHKDEYRCMVGW
jgi:hypothetical protein